MEIIFIYIIKKMNILSSQVRHGIWDLLRDVGLVILPCSLYGLTYFLFLFSSSTARYGKSWTVKSTKLCLWTLEKNSYSANSSYYTLGI